MVGIDRLLFRGVNGWSEALDPLLTDFSVAHDWAYFRLSMVAVVLALAVLGKGRAALLCLLAFPLADALCNAAKHLAPAMRPFQILPHVMMRVGFSDSMGTASSHAGNLAAVATVMSLVGGWRWGLPWILVAFLVGGVPRLRRRALPLAGAPRLGPGGGGGLRRGARRAPDPHSMGRFSATFRLTERSLPP